MIQSQLLFPIEHLRLFANEGKVYHAFHHFIAARMGTLLLVPQHLVTGNCDGVAEGCPVPCEEVHAVLEYPVKNKFTNPAAWHGDDFVHQLACLGIQPDWCEMDYITPMVNGEEKVLRIVHPSGVRYAVVVNW